MHEGELDRRETRRFMIACHGRKCVDGSPYSRHSVAVAELAEPWGTRHFRRNQLVMPLDQIMIDNMWHAAILHDTIKDGNATWDDILDVTNLEVARLVAILTHDSRLSRTRRLQEYTNCLLHADYPAKIIKLADLSCDLQDALKLLRDWPERAKMFLKEWPDEALECVVAINKLAQKRFEAEWTWCRETALALGTIARRWDRREDILREINAYPKIPKRGRKS